VSEKGGTTYYRDDGVKLVKNGEGEIVVRKWNLDDDGNLCQTLVRSNKMDCLDGRSAMKIARNGDALYLYENGTEKAWLFTLKEGNSANITQ